MHDEIRIDLNFLDIRFWRIMVYPSLYNREMQVRRPEMEGEGVVRVVCRSYYQSRDLV